MVFTRVWSGSQALSERLDIIKLRRRLSSISKDRVFHASPRTIERPYLTHISSSAVIDPQSHKPFLSRQRSTSMRGARVVHCTMIQALRYIPAIAFGFSYTDLMGLFSLCVFRSHLPYIWPCHLVFQHGIKAGGRWVDHGS